MKIRKGHHLLDGVLIRNEARRVKVLPRSYEKELLEVCEAIAKLNEGQGQLNMCQIAAWAKQVIAEAKAERAGS